MGCGSRGDLVAPVECFVKNKVDYFRGMKILKHLFAWMRSLLLFRAENKELWYRHVTCDLFALNSC
jgi:hypothetical protein